MFWFIIIVIIIPFFVFIKPYNNAQALAQKAKSNYSKIGSGIQKKVQLINQLIDITKGYGDHEKLIYLKVSEDFSSVYKKAGSALLDIKSFESAFPNIKTDKLYADLMSKLEKLEDEILGRRDQYNSAVEAYNTASKQMPLALVANVLGFKEMPYLDLDDENNAVTIKQFNTDDGELLREFLKTTSNKVGEVTVKGATKLTEVTKKGMEKVAHRDKKTQEITEESLEKVDEEIKEEE
jgi:LemA family protein